MKQWRGFNPPLSQLGYHVLAALAWSGRLHAYGVRQQVLSLSKSGIMPTQVAVGRTLRALLELDLVKIDDQLQELGSPDPRRGASYVVTDLGRKKLISETRRIRFMCGVVDAALARARNHKN